MRKLWDEYIGSSSLYTTAVLWEIAQQEGKDAIFLSPQEAVDEMTVKDGFKVNPWASEPMITQPMAFCWDDKGRLWVAENRDYESRGSGFSSDGNSPYSNIGGHRSRWVGRYPKSISRRRSIPICHCSGGLMDYTSAHRQICCLSLTRMEMTGQMNRI